MKADRERFKKFFHGMLTAGVYLAPSQFEAGFIFTAHCDVDIGQTVTSAAKGHERPLTESDHATTSARGGSAESGWSPADR